MSGPDNTTGRSLPEETELSRLYRNGARETPAAALDGRIRASARDAVARPGARHRARRWAWPVSIAAMVVLCAGVVLQISRNNLLPLEGAVSTEETATPPAKTRALSDEAATDRAGGAGAAGGRREEAAEMSEMKKIAPQGRPRSDVSRLAAPARPDAERPPGAAEEKAAAAAAVPARGREPGADVVSVAVSGSPGAYYFAVTIRSPDTGCKQYADWWEVVGLDGRLLYRRVLFHSHAQEQPFERSGGPVPIRSDTVVWVRAHMNTVGYGGVAFKGSVNAGFKPASPVEGFAAALENQRPLPDGCAF
jgi:hypothetical protein